MAVSAVEWDDLTFVDDSKFLLEREDLLCHF